MALQPKVGLIESQNFSLLSVYDNTGVYDIATNPGGFGVPNPDSTTITGLSLKFTFDEIEGFTQVDMVLVSGVIQSATKIDTLGNVVPLVLATYNIANFPNNASTAWNFPASFFSPSTEFVDQYVKVEYSLTDGFATWTNTTFFLLSKASDCCSKKAIAKYADNDCKDKFPTRIVNALYALNYQNAVGNIDAARETLKRIEKLCCDCGCGCGGDC